MVVLGPSSEGHEFKSFRIILCSRSQDLKSAQLKRGFEVQTSELEIAKGSSLLLNKTIPQEPGFESCHKKSDELLSPFQNNS